MNRSIFAVVAVSALVSAANAQTFGLSGAGPIPDGTGANVAGAPLNMGSGAVVGTFATISNVSVNFSTAAGAAPHTWLGDLVITLTYDAGNDSTIDGSITLISRVGQTVALTGAGDGSDLGGAYNFVDGGASFWAAATTATTTQIVPAGAYSASAPLTGNALSFATVFGGLSSSGTWTLTFTDWYNGDTVAISDASVVISTIPTPGAAALLGLAGIAAGRRRR